MNTAISTNTDTVQLPTASGATSVTISHRGETTTVSLAEAMETADEMVARLGAGIPTFSYWGPSSALARTEPAPPSVSDQTTAAKVAEGSVDKAAKVRIDAQQKVLREAGITGIGHVSEGGDSEQFFVNGTRMMASGYATQEGRHQDHLKSLPLAEAAALLVDAVRSEGREDQTVSAKDFANSLHVNGKITAFGYSISEQAIRGLTARLESPMLSYVLGLRNRVATEMAKPEVATQPNEETRNPELSRADRAKIADILRHECLRNPDVQLKMRTRKNPKDIFAVLSPSYSPADAPEVVDQILHKISDEMMGTYRYDATSTSWELRASVWTPTPVEEQAVGEPFSGYVSFRARDNGTAKFRGGGGIEILRCLNASVYVTNAVGTDRVHRGRVLYDIEKMLASATKAIDALCAAWGANRATEVEIPVVDDAPIPLSVAIPGFWRFMLTDKRSELQGVLAGRTETHVENLTSAFFSERRVPEKLVRSDFAQGWTRSIQALPMSQRLEGETAIADWLVSNRPIRCELKDKG